MAVRLGGGDYTFEVNENWAKIPDEIVLGDCAAVGVDSKDNVYAFNRGDHPVAVFDKDGNLLRTWGEGLFPRPHGVHVAPDDTIWLTDDADHTVRHCTLDGRVLLTLGIPGKPSPYMSGEPFHRCTHTALSPQGDFLYISDGYGNARIHKYTPGGKLLSSWGEPGTDPGQFNIPHNICCDPDGWIYVADRENRRVQMFTNDGKFIKQLIQGDSLFARSVALSPDQDQQFLYVGDGDDIKIVDRKTLEVLGKINLPGMKGGGHLINTDAKGNIYVANTGKGMQKLAFKGMAAPTKAATR